MRSSSDLRISPVHGSPKRHGSCGTDSMCEWLRQNGWTMPSSVQRASSSGFVSP